MIDMINAISPGTIIVRLSRVALYHTLDSRRRGSSRVRP